MRHMSLNLSCFVLTNNMWIVWIRQMMENCNFTGFSRIGIFQWFLMVNSMRYKSDMKIRYMSLCSFQPALSNGISFVLMRWFFIKMRYINIYRFSGFLRTFQRLGTFARIELERWFTCHWIRYCPPFPTIYDALVSDEQWENRSLSVFVCHWKISFHVCWTVDDKNPQFEWDSRAK